MKIRDIIQGLDKPKTEITVTLGPTKIIKQPLQSKEKPSQILLSFLDKIGLDLSQTELLTNNLTDIYDINNLNISFDNEGQISKATTKRQQLNQNLVSAFLERLKDNSNLIAFDWKSKTTKKTLEKLNSSLINFLEEVTENIGESIDFFSNSEEGLDETRFDKFLKEISETLSIECMRLNQFSNSSREENLSNWKNKLESACHTNSNSFWNLSEISYYKSSLMKDFKNFKKKIKSSLNSLKQIETDKFFEANEIEQKILLNSLNEQIEENHQKILNSFQQFEENLDSGQNSEMGNTQMKVVGLPMGMNTEERGSHLTGFHFIEMINNQTAIKSKLSRPSQMHSYNHDSKESFNQVSTKKKMTQNSKNIETDSQKEFMINFNEEIKKYKKMKKGDIFQENLSRSDSDSVVDKIMERDNNGFHKKMGFGFFMLHPEKNNECSSIYDSSMTHRLLDALLDDNMLSDKKTSVNREVDKMAFSKTTDPETSGLKDLLSKIKKDMQKKMSIQEVGEIGGTLPELQKTVESIQTPEINEVGKEMEESESVHQVIDIYQDKSETVDQIEVESEPTQRIQNFRSNTVDIPDNLVNPFSQRNPGMVKSSTISEAKLVNEFDSIGESLQKRFKQKRYGSLVSQQSNTSTNENWRSRLGEKLNLRSKLKNLDLDNQKVNVPTLKMLNPCSQQKITEESNELYQPEKTNKVELIRSPEVAKCIQKRLKNLIMKPDKEDKELLKQQLVRASKVTKSISRSILSKDSSIEVANETIGVLVTGAQNKVFRKIRKGIQKEDDGEDDYIETKVRDLPRYELEDSLIQLWKQLKKLGLGKEKIVEGVTGMVKDALEQMKMEVETPFEDLVKVNISRLEELRNHVDVMEMENIELEYGMLKLTQMYNEIIQTLSENGITLEMPDQTDDSQEDIKTQVVKPFSLKDFRDQVKRKVQDEKNELDKNLFEIREDALMQDEELEDSSCLQMKSVEINWDQDHLVSENTVESEQNKEILDKRVDSRTNDNTSEIMIRDMGKTSNQVSPSNSELRFKMKDSSWLGAKSTEEGAGRRYSLLENPKKISRLTINDKSNIRKQSLMKSNGSLLIDFNKESNGFKSRKMIKTISGAIKTVDEMKEEYYTIKRFNVELLVENQELGRLNHELNSENLKNGKQISELNKKISEYQKQRVEEEKKKENGDKLKKLERDYSEVLEQNKKLVEDSKGMTDFMLMNFKKVVEDLTDSRDELNFTKRELSIEIQMLKRLVMKKLVPKLEEANNNCNLLCAVNDDYEKEKGEVTMKVNLIHKLCLENGNKGGVMERISILCQQIFEIQEQSNSQVSQSGTDFELTSRKGFESQNMLNTQEEVEEKENEEKKQGKTGESNQIGTCLTVPSKDYNKLIYSELSLESGQKLSNERNIMIKPSIERGQNSDRTHSVKESMQESKESNLSSGQYQINYDNSYNGRSSTSGESEEFNNGMDVLLKEYMTDKIKKKSEAEPGPSPPYNTEQQDIDLDEYILKTDESGPARKEDEVGDLDKDFEINVNTMGQIKEEKDQIGLTSQSLSRNWPTSKNNQIDDADLDRESGFEDIVEKLIGIVCLEDEEMRDQVCKIYNKMFNKNEGDTLGTNEEMLRSLQESLNFKNKMIECLSESEKQNIAKDALQIFKNRIEGTNKIFMGVKSNYNSNKKKSKSDDNMNDVMVKMDRFKEENKFLVSELERQNKLSKSMTSEVETLREENGQLKQKNEELNEEISILQQRIDLFDRDNQTEMSEYNDDYQYDPMAHRLSNNMLIIQEADEEYEIDSMLSGQDLQDQAQKMILGKFDNKADQVSIDNESHYSFFKDYGKSDDEGDFDTENIGSLPEIKPKIIKRRATESGRRNHKDQLNKYIEELTSNPIRKRPKKRRTIGNVGMSLVRKKLERTESYNVNTKKEVGLDFDEIGLKLNKTLDESTTKSQDFKKIQLRRLISDPLSKSASNNNKTGELCGSPTHVNKPKISHSLGNSEIITPEPMISFISQEKSTNQRFNFSKNFDENENLDNSGTLRSEPEISDDQFANGSATTHKFKNSNTKDLDNILRDLEIFHVISFSSSNSSINPNFKAKIEKKGEDIPVEMDYEESHVIKNKIIDVYGNQDEKETQLRSQVNRLRSLLTNNDLSRKLLQGVEVIEYRLLEIDEKIKKIQSMKNKTPELLEKYKSTEQSNSNSKMRPPGFTSQFSSCRSIENSKSPDIKKSKVKAIQLANEDRPSRVLFGNSTKRTSRFLLREFINKNFEPSKNSPNMLSPFEKKTPLKMEYVKEKGNEEPSERKSTNGVKALEVENLRLKNQLDNEKEIRIKLQNDLEEGKQGLERLLESMPRKVKQSPLLKMGDKHFREILELVKFQVEEYKDVIKEYKEQSKAEFSIEDSEGEKTEDLVGTSVMNSRQHSSDEDQFEFGEESKEENKTNEISITYIQNNEESKNVSKQSSNQFNWGEESKEENEGKVENEKEEGITEERDTLNIEIPESMTLKSEDKSEEFDESKQITFEEMRRKQYVVQGPNTQENGKEMDNELYQSSGVKRGEMLMEKIDKKREEVNRILDSYDDNGALVGVFDEIENEIKLFIENLNASDFESVGMNLYKKTSQKYSENLQMRLMEIEDKYQNLEREMQELRTENMRMTQEMQKEDLEYYDEKEYYGNDQEESEEENMEESIHGEGKEEDTREEVKMVKEIEIPDEEIQIHNEKSNEEDYLEHDTEERKSERQKAIDEADKEITEEINEMIFDLLEVIEDRNISTVEKMKVIRIFLHHTHDLLGNHEQMHLMEQSHEYNTGEGSSMMQQFPSNPRDSQRYMQNTTEEKNEQEYEENENEQETEEETNLECWEEKLEIMPDNQEDYLSREMVVMEDKQLTEIKEDDGSEDYDSHDPKSGVMNQVETNQGKEFRDERGYSSLEVMHDRAGETETKVGNYEREGYESAHLIEERRREGGSRKGSQIEECLHDQINELEDEKVGLKNKNIMLNDKISFLNQKLALLETRLEEMEKSYLTTKAEKKEFRGRYETKSKQLKEANQKISELTEEKMKLEEEINRLHSNAEEKSEQVKEMIEKVESLQELNNQLALDNERKSQELMEYSLMRSSINTDSRTSSGRDQSNKFIYPEKFSNMENKKNSMENFEMGSEGNFNLNAMEQQEVATDRSEYPKGFGMQQVHLEEIIDQKQEIKKLRSEKYELISKMNNIKEDAKLSCFKYEENLRELKSKLKKFKEKEVSDFRGSTWFKKKVSSCKIENELRKKNLKISKLTSQIQKLQGQLKSYPQDSHSIHSKRFSNNQRLSSNTESKNSLYQRE